MFNVYHNGLVVAWFASLDSAIAYVTRKESEGVSDMWYDSERTGKVRNEGRKIDDIYR